MIDGTDDANMLFLFFNPFSFSLWSFRSPFLDSFFFLDGDSFDEIVDYQTFLIFNLYLLSDVGGIGDTYLLHEG